MRILGVVASSSREVPNAPTIGTATDVGTGRAFNNGAATVTFTAPTWTGGLPITGYTVTSSPGGYTGTGSSSPITVAGLQSNTNYTFTVRATNAIGQSAASAASNSILATTVPQAPTIGTATDLGTGTSVSVAFTGNATGGKAVSTYTATSSPSSITGSSASSPITVSGLTAGTAYTFTVTATNANGTSTASAASNSVTPAVPTSFESIATVTPSGATTVTFSSLPSTYKSFQIRGIAQFSGSGFGTGRVTFNGDTGSNYTFHRLHGDGSNATSSGSSSIANIPIQLNAGNSQSNGVSSWGSFVIDIIDPSSTSKNKTLRSISGASWNDSIDTNQSINAISGMWNNTSAISTITITTSFAFLSGSSFALYGIRG